MAHVWAFPYLPLHETVKVGPVMLVPRGGVPALGSREPWMLDRARRFLEFHRLPRYVDIAAHKIGCLVVPESGIVGDYLQDELMQPLGRAVAAALLDTNPRRPGRRDQVRGHEFVTSENAILFGYRLTPDGGLAIERGGMVPTLVGGFSVDSDFVDPPEEVVFPLLPGRIDIEYCSALLAVLRRDEEVARRLGHAIDWLTFAWTNGAAIRWPMRLVALRAGFEVLLGVGEKFEPGREALRQLLAPGEPRRLRARRKLDGVLRRDRASKLEWWFTKLCFLRNAIMHGESPSERDAVHVLLGEAHLRHAIKAVVAREGFPDVLEEQFARHLRRTTERCLREQAALRDGRGGAPQVR